MYIVHSGFPGDSYAILAMILWAAPTEVLSVHLGELEVPRSLLPPRGGDKIQYIFQYMAEQIYTHKGVWDELQTIRMLQAMCKRRFDDVSRGRI